MKIKRTTYREFEEKFGGLNRLKIRRKDGTIDHYGTSIVPVRYRVNVCYRHKKDCTYVALTCLGYLDIFGPKADDLTIVIRFDGNVTGEDLINSDFQYKDGFNAVMEELENDWRRKLDSRKD